MNIFYFSCNYEERECRVCATVFENEFLFLFEVEPEDKALYQKFGVKFITQPKAAPLDIRCVNSAKEHAEYELVMLASLMEFLLSGRM